MYILGISCEHDSGAALIDDTGEIIAAANEERYNRKKLYTGFPIHSILSVLNIAGIPAEKVDVIAIASTMHVNENDWNWDKFSFKRDAISFALRFGIFKRILSNHKIIDALVRVARNRSYEKRITRQLIELGFKARIDFYDHHLCHINSAIHTCGFENGIALSFDAQGDGYSSKAYYFNFHGCSKRIIYKNVFFKSPAHYYGYITQILGFKPMEHEGKVTGLAGSGCSDDVYPLLNSRLYFDEEKNEFISKGYYVRPEIAWLKKRLKNIPREDAAAGVQKHLEDNIISYIRHLFMLVDTDSITVAGGIFANVLLNQKISEMREVRQIHIHPHMGDGGLALGAAVEIASQQPKYKNRRLKNAFFGPEPLGNINILTQNYGLREINDNDTYLKSAQLLAKGKIICLVEGRMEYGPRALCHRSIICNPADKSINDSLNAKLKRSEFMPFAPIILDGDIDKYFYDTDKKLFPMDFMTITSFTKKIFQEQAPAANHVDNTARPQVVYKETGSIYNILKHYRNITSSSVLINTSFNMHGEPIVNTFEDAIKTFLICKLDYILLNGRLFSHPDNLKDH